MVAVGAAYSGKMNQEEILAQLKKDVRSLLVSSKRGLEPDELKREYHTMMGQPMPLKLLGFRNILHMAEEMPDVVSINFRSDGSTFFKAISDEFTRNIEELVAKQRSKPVKKVRRGGASCLLPRPVILPRRGPVPPSVPAQLRAQFRILLSQGPIRLSDLECCYLRCFGQPLHFYNYGFFSTEEMLGSAADLFVIKQSRFGSLLSLRDHMVPKPLLRPSSSSKRTALLKPALLRTGSPDSKVPTRPPAEVPEKPTSQNQSSTQASLDSVHNEAAPVSSKLVKAEKNQEAKPQLPPEGQLFDKCVLELEEQLRQQILENGVAGTISQELKDKLRAVVGQTDGGLSVHKLPTEYKRLFGEDLPLQQNGFVSVTELVDAMGDTFQLKPAGGGSGQDWIIRNIHGSANIQSDSEERESFNDAQKLPLKSWQVDGDHVTVDDESKELETSNKTKEMISEMYTMIQGRHSPAVPLDALQNQRLKPPTRHPARELVAVLVEWVESPGHFYIRFSETEEARAMEDMMFEMRRCYHYPQVLERYRLPQRFVRRGQVCCVSPAGMWFYRVVIHKVINPTQVEVYYVDFGDVMVVPTANLKFLKSAYSVLPVQAVPSSLAGIKPTSGCWTLEAIAEFKKLSCVRTLVGALDCYSGDVLQLYLCDTHTDDDIYIHSVLLSQGHGTPCSPADTTAVSVQDTLVSLYLGEGMFDLPDVEEEMISSHKQGDASIMDALKVEDDEMPGLEYIGDSKVIYNIQTPSVTSPPIPPVSNPTSVTPEEVLCQPKDSAPSVATPPPILSTLSLHTAALGQIQDGTWGGPISPCHP
ncbi:tudor domain-containing protein 5-like isoform X1 [Archocentrus centrarchus]|uniref:tudor domain-containing protein 5-like isoform X1 n=2 Tax=Archocentrus centrarchus TaxID=63155 RepID=UPI0011EA39A5|nr:tudor domain-containing protein 5-like isoform X1 [Archocentrus centrarchus]